MFREIGADKIENILILGGLGAVSNATTRVLINNKLVKPGTVFHLLDIVKDPDKNQLIKYLKTHPEYPYVYHEIDISNPDEVYAEFNGNYFNTEKINTIFAFLPDDTSIMLDIADTAGKKIFYVDASVYVNKRDPQNKEEHASSEYDGFSSSAQYYTYSKYKNILGLCSCGMNPGMVNYFAHLGVQKYGKDNLSAICVVEDDIQKYKDPSVVPPYTKLSSWCVSALYEETTAFGVIFKDFYNSISVRNNKHLNTTPFTNAHGEVVRGDIVTHEECHLISATYGCESTFIYKNPYSQGIREIVDLPAEEQAKYSFQVMSPTTGEIEGWDEVGVQIQYKDGKTVYVYNASGQRDDIGGTPLQVGVSIVAYLLALAKYSDELATKIVFCENILKGKKESEILNFMSEYYKSIDFPICIKESDENWKPIKLLSEVNGDKDWRASKLVAYHKKTNKDSSQSFWLEDINGINKIIMENGCSAIEGLVTDIVYNKKFKQWDYREANTRLLLFLTDKKYENLVDVCNMELDEIFKIMGEYKVTPLMVRSCFTYRYDKTYDKDYERDNIIIELVQELLGAESYSLDANRDFKIFDFFKYSDIGYAIQTYIAQPIPTMYDADERNKFLADVCNYYKHGTFPFTNSILNLLDYDLFYASWVEGK